MGRWAIIGSATAVILVASIVGYSFYQSAKKPTAVNKKTVPVSSIAITHVCTSDMVARAGGAIADNNIVGMRAVYEEFSKNTAYTGDATCNYIATRYYIAVGNEIEARKHLDALKLGMSAGDDVSKSFTPPAQPTSELEAMVGELTLIKNGSASMSTSATELDEIDKRAP